jgi:hypothetical protein
MCPNCVAGLCSCCSSTRSLSPPPQLQGHRAVTKRWGGIEDEAGLHPMLVVVRGGDGSAPAPLLLPLPLLPVAGSMLALVLAALGWWVDPPPPFRVARPEPPS